MKKIFLPIFACILLGASSCESMLEIPQKGVVSIETYYVNDDDAQAALTGMYGNYLTTVAGTDGNYNPEMLMINYSADDILAGGSDYTSQEGYRHFDEFQFDNANKVIASAYSKYMTAIYHTNLVISNFTNENKKKTEPVHTSELTKKAVAEARVMRAYLHMMLALIWERPPIVDRLQEGDDLPTNAESQDQVLEWVVNQCKMALESGYLPKRNGTGDKNATARMSVGFAQFIIGKASMFRGDFETARQYLGALIESGDYALVPSEDFWTNFHIAGDGNSEKIFEPNILEDPDFTVDKAGKARSRWNQTCTFCWSTKTLASVPDQHSGYEGWGGGVIQETFAKRFLEHDGDSPRRRASFLTAEEWLYEMEWNSDVNDGTLEEKKADDKRGISSANGMFSHSYYFEWKHMVFTNPPKILTGGKEYPGDNIVCMGKKYSQINFKVARYAEALLLYAEACIGTADATKGLAALNLVQERSGSNKISNELTFAAVMEEKQYELWFETCRYFDLVRWSKQRPNDVNLDDIYNKSEIHKKVPRVFDTYFTEVEGYEQNLGKDHVFYVTYSSVPGDSDFKIGKNEYFPFPLEYTEANPMLRNVGGWAAAQ